MTNLLGLIPREMISFLLYLYICIKKLILYTLLTIYCLLRKKTLKSLAHHYFSEHLLLIENHP